MKLACILHTISLVTLVASRPIFYQLVDITRRNIGTSGNQIIAGIEPRDSVSETVSAEGASESISGVEEEGGMGGEAESTGDGRGGSGGMANLEATGATETASNDELKGSSIAGGQGGGGEGKENGGGGGCDDSPSNEPDSTGESGSEIATSETNGSTGTIGGAASGGDSTGGSDSGASIESSNDSTAGPTSGDSSLETTNDSNASSNASSNVSSNARKAKFAEHVSNSTLPKNSNSIDPATTMTLFSTVTTSGTPVAASY